jgi:hypothetical protein
VKDLQIENVDFELDSKKVVDQFHQNNNIVSEYGAIIIIIIIIIIECRQLFPSFLETLMLSLL